MDELILSGKKYISSKRAHELTGYAKDYVGQLARSGKIPATRAGRAWYVLEEALLSHKTGEMAPMLTQAIQKYKKPLLHHHLIADIPKTWTSVRYFNDDRALIPPVNSSELNKNDDTRNNKETLDISDGFVKNSIKITQLDTEKELPVTQQEKVHIHEVPVGQEIRISSPLPKAGGSAEKGKRPLVQFKQGTLIPVAFAISGFTLIVISSSLFLSFEIDYQGMQSNTAAVSLSGEYLPALFNYLTGPLRDFYNVIIGSFWTFFQLGFDFVAQIPSRINEILQSFSF